MADVLAIDLNERTIDCWVCGVGAPYRWGIPHDDCGDLVSNDYEGETGNVAVCQACYQAHAEGLLTQASLAYWRRRAQLERKAMDHLIVRP